MISAGIADALIHIFKTQQLNSITRANIDAFYYLVKSNDNIETLIAKQPFKGLVRLLDHTDEEIINGAINSIYKIVLVGQQARPTLPLTVSQIPILNFSQVEKIFALFNRKLSADTTNTSALCLYNWMKNAVRKILRELALDDVYKAEIEKDGFVIPNKHNIQIESFQVDFEVVVSLFDCYQLTVVDSQIGGVYIVDVFPTVIDQTKFLWSFTSDSEDYCRTNDRNGVNSIISRLDKRQLSLLTLLLDIFASIRIPVQSLYEFPIKFADIGGGGGKGSKKDGRLDEVLDQQDDRLLLIELIEELIDELIDELL
ncbi:MAG: hypothetical protein EZS28_005057 [Streblomastix strix]|uniref:Uncharacterized protein n=1 Tax=Streblomastix strix TaxID=222440 RepID=A0A5J4WWJ9_9EUKA|nr:MAG: hypothetical protein EZS28_005057 [Streblomastix strix]